jgi:hypothetical protein
VNTCYTGCLPPKTSVMVTHGPLSAPPTNVHTASLAFTGLDMAALVFVGVILLAAGTLAVLWAKGRAPSR